MNDRNIPSKNDLSRIVERLRRQMDWYTHGTGPAPFMWDDLCVTALAALESKPVETPAPASNERVCQHGVDLRTAHCLQCEDPSFHAAARTRMDAVNTATTIPSAWTGHAPDLVRDNRLMHERLAEQDREIARLTELLRIAEARAFPHETDSERCSRCGAPATKWLKAQIAESNPEKTSREPGYMGDINGPGCDPDVP